MESCDHARMRMMRAGLGGLVDRLWRGPIGPERRLGLGIRVLFALAFAAVPLSLALSLDLDLMMAGFPDSSVTAYDRARAEPGNLLVDASLLIACGLAVLALLARQRRDLVRIGVLLVAYVVLFEATKYTLDYVLKSVLNLDYGQGG